MSAFDKLNDAILNAGETPCQNAPELYFPEKDDAFQQIRYAKKQCDTCSIVNQCLEYALEAGEQHGIWGGTTPMERRQLRRKARRASEPQLA
jgi:WhiB family redox-sensing transcriptional regulator